MKLKIKEEKGELLEDKIITGKAIYCKHGKKIKFTPINNLLW